MNRQMIAIGSLMGFLAVIAGTFGAHGLEQRLSEDMLHTYEVGVRYHMYHALVLLALGGWSHGLSPKHSAAMLVSFSMGIILFSGSLYLLAISGIRWLGMITPLGGLCFLVGWGLLFFISLSKRL